MPIRKKHESVGGIEKAMQVELPGLLNWALEMPDDDFNEVIQSISEELSPSQRLHLCETNKLAAWIDDNLVLDASSKLYCGNSLKSIDDQFEKKDAIRKWLYSNYEHWCLEKGHLPISVNRFSSSTEDIAGHLSLPVELLKRDSTGRAFIGVCLPQTI